MFDFETVESLTVAWPVRIDIGDGAEERLAPPFDVLFAVLPTSETQPLLDAGDVAGLLRLVVVGWDQAAVVHRDKSPLAFSADALERLIRIPRVQSALFVAYLAAAAGRREKNFATPRASGRANGAALTSSLNS
jgi:hypothetical protein